MKKLLPKSRIVHTISALTLLLLCSNKVLAQRYLYNTSNLTQLSTTASPSTNNVQIVRLDLDITTGGGNRDFIMTQIRFAMNNSNPASVENAHLYYSNVNVFPGGAPLATIANPTGIINFNINQLCNVLGPHYFWLTYDINASANICDTYDASIPVNGLTYTEDNIVGNMNTPIPNDPAGEAVIDGPMALNNFYHDQPNASPITIGSTDQEIIRVPVIMDGNTGTQTMERMRFSTNGSTDPSGDILSAKLYYTGTSNTFSTTTALDVIGSPNGIFDAFMSQNLAGCDTNFFWLAYDISGGATVGNTVSAECTEIEINSNSFTPGAAIAPLGRTLVNFSGTRISVGNSGDFMTIEQAYNSIAAATLLANDVIIEVQDDYDENLEDYPVIFSSIASTTNTVTIRPDTNVTNLVSDAVGLPAQNFHLFVFDGADYVILDGRPAGQGNLREWTIRNIDLTVDANGVIEFRNDATHNALQYLNIEGEHTQKSVMTGLITLGGGTTTGNDHILIDFCRIGDLTANGIDPQFPVVGIMSQGSSAAAANDNVIVRDCEFVDIVNSSGDPTFEAASIFLWEFNGNWTIQNNHFYQTKSYTTDVDFTFITIAGSSSMNIQNNFFGGQAPNTMGSEFDLNNGGGQFNAIFYKEGTASMPPVGTHNILNNTIANMDLTSAYTAGNEFAFRMIRTLGAADYNINSNYIGEMDLTKNDATNGNGLGGIVNNASGVTNINDNTFEEIFLQGDDGARTALVYATDGRVTLDLNTFGGTSTDDIEVISNSALFGVQNLSDDVFIVRNNTFRNITQSATGSDFDLIYHNGTDQFTCNLNSIYGIYNDGEGQTRLITALDGAVSIDNNEISDVITNGTNNSAAFYGIYVTADGLTNITNNTIGGTAVSDILLYPDADAVAIYRQSTTATGNTNVTGNTIQNIDMQSGGSGTADFFGIRILGRVANVSNNDILYISNDAELSSPSITGIMVSEAVGGHTIGGNTISDLYLTAGAGNPTARGIHVAGGGGGLIEKNHIGDFFTDLDFTSFYGINIPNAAGPWQIENNVLVLEDEGGSHDVLITGIRNFEASNPTRFYHNTVVIDGVDAGSSITSCYERGGANDDDLKNNIFQNLRQGASHYAINAVNTGGNFVFDYNYLESDNNPSEICHYNGIDMDFTTWQGAQVPQAANSITGTETVDEFGYATGAFVADVGIDLSPVITDDKDGTARDATPWIGAYEVSTPPCAPLNGAYTIGGTSPDYTTWGDAVADLINCGVDGPVDFDVRDGVYNEQISIPAITGASAANTIIFQSESGDSSAVTLSFNANSTDNYTLQLDGADFIEFYHLGFEATNTASGRVIDIRNGAENNVFNGNYFLGVVTTSSSADVAIIHSPSGSRDDGNEFRQNRFEDGGQGMYYFGDNTNKEVGTVISENVFEEQHFKGIWAYYQDGLEISGNSLIDKTNSSSSYTGIYPVTSDNVDVFGNSVISQRGSTMLISGGSNILIANNMFYVTGNDGSQGLRCLGTPNTVNIFHNSINVDNTNGASMGIDLNNGSNYNVQNNIVVNTGAGRVYKIDVGVTGVTSNNNNFYSTASTFGNYLGTSVSDLSGWIVTSTLDLSSVSVNPGFVSSNDLHLAGPGPNALNAGADLTAIVSEDFDGDVRSVPTWMGADIGVLGVAPYPNEPGSGFALEFDGLDDRVDLPVNFDPSSNNFSVEAWFKADAITATDQVIIGQTNGTGVGRRILYVNNNGRLVSLLGGTPIIGATTVDAGTWYHAALTYNAGSNTISLYLNGNLDASIAGTAPESADGNWVIGEDKSGTLQWGGCIDEIRMWSATLNLNQIREYMCQKRLQSHGNYAQLQAYYRFDDGANGQLVDLQGTYDGTLVNMTPATDWVYSGAMIGDTSVFDYSGGASLTLNSGEGSMTVTNPSGDDLHLYYVYDTANSTTPPTGYDSIDVVGYWGVLNLSSSANLMDVVLDYSSRGDVDGHPNESGVQLIGRSNNANLSWGEPSPPVVRSNDPIANTVSVTSITGRFEALMGFAPACDPLIVTLTTDANSAGGGVCGDLRFAMEYANSNAGNDTIIFNIPFTLATDVHTISPQLELPDIAGTVIIDGGSQNDFSGAADDLYLIEVSGVSAGVGLTRGFDFTTGSSSSRFTHMVVNGFNEDEVFVRNTAGVMIDSCRLGVDPTGLIDRGTANHTLGTDNADDCSFIRNIISGADFDGLFITGGSEFNLIAGNIIGLGADSVTIIANQDEGMTLDNSSSNLIGGTSPDQGNLISGNVDIGIEVRNASSSNQFLGNIIGLDGTGNVARGNSNGIAFITNSTNNQVGSGAAGGGNVISGNNGNGITIDANNITVLNNYIGTNSAGTAAVANTASGIQVTSAVMSTNIGDQSGSGGNLISGNAVYELRIDGGDNNTIYGNYFGTDATGNATIATANTGIRFGLGSTGNQIGSTMAPNVIGGFALYGVWTPSAANSNGFTGNYVGVGADGTTPIPNGTGIMLTGTSNWTIDSNLVAYNTERGIRLIDAASDNNLIHYNSIHSNGQEGIFIQDPDGQDGVLPPEITGLSLSGMDTVLSGTSSPGAWIQIFCDSTHEGQVFLDTTYADAAGNWSKIINGYGMSFANGLDSLTATQDSAGNTSEFSAPFFKQVCDTAATASTHTWTGAKSDDWFDCANWDVGTLPSSSCAVIIPGGTPFEPRITGGTAYCSTIQINSPAGALVTLDTPGGGDLRIGP